jgi:hypothetical protein
MNLTRIGAWVLFAGVLGSCWGCYPSDIPAGVPSCVRQAIEDESLEDEDYTFLIRSSGMISWEKRSIC